MYFINGSHYNVNDEHSKQFHQDTKKPALTLKIPLQISDKIMSTV